MLSRSLVLLPAVLLALGAPGLARHVVIHEVHFEPEEKTVPEEFIELYNPSDAEVDLSGWFFSAGIRYRFPEGTTLAPASYLVLAEDPEALGSRFGVEALGPYEGRLANEGETLILRNALGGIEDLVDYRAAFPWSIAAAGKGSSLELIHPSLDNSLGGNWRASGLVERPFRERIYILRAGSAEWRYRKGTSEASDPVTLWREPDFIEDGAWETGRTPIGFGDGDEATILDDMRGSYTTIFLRHAFELDPGAELPEELKLAIRVDDGAYVWINGVPVAAVNVRDEEPLFNGRARSSREPRWEGVILPPPASYLRPGRNLLAIHAFNASLSSADFSIDAELFVPGTEDEDPDALAPPTPGRRNTVHAENAPPAIRQLGHSPQEPREGEPIALTARVSDPDGVARVSAHLQVVRPGHYIPAFLPLPHAQLLANPRQELPENPEFEDPSSWTELAMRDDGEGGDAAARDGVYTAVVEGLGSRTLLRYRISASDTHGESVVVPYKDDPSLNFACFINDGVPAYTASRLSVHPDGPGHVYSAEVMSSLPVYFLITREEDMTQCVAYNTSFQIPKSNEGARDKFNWEGAFVYDGVVYDHVTYRLRQANDRYGGSGKRSMRIRFRKGNYLQARDNYGRLYPTRWRTVNTGKMFDNKRVGNFGLTETMNALLWNMVGVPAPWFHTFHFRVVDGEAEVPKGPNGQFLGDFWGMFNAIEDYDPRFLEAHGLTDGNLYKLKDGIFNGNELRRNQGRFAVTTDVDFQNIRQNLRPQRTDDWLDAHVNYDRWYPYHAVVEGVRHYDFVPADSHSKNRAWFFEPYRENEHGRLWTLPWDSDASWGPNWNEGIDYSKNAIFGGLGKPAFKEKYRNALREFRDLVWTEEVIHSMIDDLAAFVLEFSMADRDRWRGAPPQAGQQDFGPIEPKVLDMKRFAFSGWSGSTGPTVPAGGRARHLDALAAAEGAASRIPETPVVVSTSPAGFPMDGLTFQSSPFRDPQPEDSLAAMKWRLGEVSLPDAPFDPISPRVYEVPAVWEEEYATFLPEVLIPRTAVTAGRTYRVRARIQDDTGRWSHWSAPVEFTAGPPASPAAEAQWLRITELMFHPQYGNGFEFVELQNTGPEALDLSSVRFTEGIRFSFAGAGVKSLAPGEYVVLVEDRAVFETHYDASGILIAGEYSGRLSNAGERLELAFGTSETILSFEYDDAWFRLTDGGGFSLVVRAPMLPSESWSEREAWSQGRFWGGTPGRGEEGGLPGSALPGDVAMDGRVDVGDAVAIVRHLVLASPEPLPCGGGTLVEPANRTLLDIDGDGAVALTDAIHLLVYLFRRGAPPALGTECAPLPGCEDFCAP